jgi:hypothetical protein
VGTQHVVSGSARLGGLQKSQSVIERSGLQFCFRGDQRASRTLRGFGRKDDRALEEGSGGGESATRLRPYRGTFEFGGNLLIRRGSVASARARWTARRAFGSADL